MKLLSIICCVYMTVLAILPCRDKDDFGVTFASTTTLSSGHQSNENSSRETCTPFCTCSCCSVVRLVSRQQQVITIFIAPVKKEYSAVAVPALCERALSIWQPPQLS